MPAAEHGQVYVVDDDLGLREALDGLFRSVGYAVESFASADGLLALEDLRRPCCIVLDVRMPGISGLELQAELGRRRHSLPIVMLTGHGDVPMCSAAMRNGAVDFLLKPFREQELLDAVAAGIARDRVAEARDSEQEVLEERHATLTPREQEVLTMVVSGMPNKVIAAKLGLSEITIKLSRGQVMRKMVAASLPALVRMADRLRGTPVRVV